MAVNSFAKFGLRTALALAVATIALPGVASAKPDDESRQSWGERIRRDGGGDQGSRPAPAPAWGGRSTPEVSTPAPQPAPRWSGGGQGGGSPGGWTDRRGDDGGQGRGSRSGGGWQGNHTPPPAPPVAVPAPAPQPPRWGGSQGTPGTWNGPRQGDGNGDRRGGGWQGDGTRRTTNDGWQGDRHRDGDRTRDGDRRRDGHWTGRDGDRTRDGDRWRDGNRHRDGDRWNNHNSWSNNRYHDNNHRRWDHRWRSNHRYDWSSYRRHNPSVFHWGSYYAPYRGYSYRRLSVGFFLDSLFFSSRYWINDPWQYRLPDVYGPYRWVRYYDDALLVNVYSGEVVDVIHNFFW